MPLWPYSIAENTSIEDRGIASQKLSSPSLGSLAIRSILGSARGRSTLYHHTTRRSKRKILRKTKNNQIEFGTLVYLNQSTESSHFEVSSALVYRAIFSTL